MFCNTNAEFADMNDEIKKLSDGKKRFLLPALVGVSVAGAITYFLMSEQTAELRKQLSENINKKWDALKDKVAGAADGDIELADTDVTVTTPTKSDE